MAAEMETMQQELAQRGQDMRVCTLQCVDRLRCHERWLLATEHTEDAEKVFDDEEKRLTLCRVAKNYAFCKYDLLGN